MLEQTINSRNFASALELISQGEKLPKNLQSYQYTQIYDNLIREKQYDILQHFVKDKTIETDVYELDSFKNSIFSSMAMYWTTDTESLSALETFLSGFDNLNDEVEGKTLLGFFFEKGAKPELIKVLINSGLHVTVLNNSEENFLHQVVKTNLMKPELSLSYLDLLLNEGLDINALNVVKKSPLMVAVELHRKYCIPFLMQNGANPNEVGKDGNTPYFHVIASHQDLENYDLMRQYDLPNFDNVNQNDVSLFFEFARMMNSSSESNLKILQNLLDDGADLYQTSIYQGEQTPVISLLVQKNVEVLELLYNSGKLDLNQQDDNGNTILHQVCAIDSYYEENKAKETYRKVKFLLENGIDATITNNNDETAIMIASKDNLKTKTVELLIKATK